jgi:23S rRNA (guanosine2251-2'-O)-methyltransferase
MNRLTGIHSVREALEANRALDSLSVAKGTHGKRIEDLVRLARAQGVPVRFEERVQLDRAAGTREHQGVVAFIAASPTASFEDLLKPRNAGAAPRLLVLLDGVEDPQNLGALLRSADGAGVDSVVMTERRAAPLSAVAAKAAAGAQEHLRIARVVNLVRSLEDLKRNNLWVIGLDERGTMDYDQFDFTGDCVLVMGREGDGLHDLVRRTCDHLLRIPMAGGVSSLNVSAAGAVVLFEAYRQRRCQQRTEAKGELRPGQSDKSSPGTSKPKKLKGLGS